MTEEFLRYCAMSKRPADAQSGGFLFGAMNLDYPTGFRIKTMKQVALNDLEVGKKYRYCRPSWDSSVVVTVEAGQGDFAGQMMIRFKPGYYPSKAKDMPADAIFTEVEN